MSMDDRFKTIEAQLELLERRVKILEDTAKKVDTVQPKKATK